jgi:hypothetical protein
MTSEKQIDANRRNAQKSSGPKSDEGKALSKMNATTHGLTAETVVIKDEDPRAFEMLRDDLIREFGPETTLEFQLIDRAAGLLWRLRRVPQIEASLMETHRLEVIYRDAGVNDSYDSSKELEAKKELRGSKASLGRAFIRGAENLDIIGKLSRYERSLVGMLNNTLYQLDQERARKERAQPSAVIELKPTEQDG